MSARRWRFPSAFSPPPTESPSIRLALSSRPRPIAVARSASAGARRRASIHSPRWCSTPSVPASRRSRPMSDFKLPDLDGLMAAAQKIQGDVARMQEELAATTCEASAGGGMVTATVNGHYELVALAIDKQVVDP